MTDQQKRTPREIAEKIDKTIFLGGLPLVEAVEQAIDAERAEVDRLLHSYLGLEKAWEDERKDKAAWINETKQLREENARLVEALIEISKFSKRHVSSAGTGPTQITGEAILSDEEEIEDGRRVNLMPNYNIDGNAQDGCGDPVTVCEDLKGKNARFIAHARNTDEVKDEIIRVLSEATRCTGPIIGAGVYRVCDNCDSCMALARANELARKSLEEK